jgi:hypothetical protein
MEIRPALAGRFFLPVEDEAAIGAENAFALGGVDH